MTVLRLYTRGDDLTVEEAEALAGAVAAKAVSDRQSRALVGQALDQIGLLYRQVRARVRNGNPHFRN
jgi:hypothetical protein